MAYTDLATVRALDVLVGNEATYPDAALTEGIAWAKQVIDDYCGTSFEADAFTVTVPGTGSRGIRLVTLEGYPVLFIRSITSATVDGVAVSDVSGWEAYPDGLVVRDTGSFPRPTVGPNVTVSGTAGVTTSAPADIAWAARTLARQYVLELYSKVPKRELTAGEGGGFGPMAHAGGVGRPTNLPDVNARLKRHRHRGLL